MEAAGPAPVGAGLTAGVDDGFELLGDVEGVVRPGVPLLLCLEPVAELPPEWLAGGSDTGSEAAGGAVVVTTTGVPLLS
jgi:hypothetical protein